VLLLNGNVPQSADTYPISSLTSMTDAVRDDFQQAWARLLIGGNVELPAGRSEVGDRRAPEVEKLR